MLELTGTITKIEAPFKTKKGNIIQSISLRREKRVFVYPEIHNNIELLNGISIGDDVQIEYELYGKEKSTLENKVHFHTIVVKNIKKL